MKNPFARTAATGSFALDRGRFDEATREEFGELVGIDADCEGGVGRALELRFADASDAGAIFSPPGVEVIVYDLNDSLIVAVREVDLPRSLPVPLRQLATYSFETKYVIDYRDVSFEEVCRAIDELLAKANSLLPSFYALRLGEMALFRRGIRCWSGRLRSLTRWTLHASSQTSASKGTYGSS
jgi:hypothetical protein